MVKINMKTLILNIVLLSLTLSVCGQESTKTTTKTNANKVLPKHDKNAVRDTMIIISVSKISSTLSINTFIKEISAGCLDISYSITTKVGGAPKIIHCGQSQFPADAKAMINNFKIGDKLLIDDIKSSCFQPTKRGYKITIGQ